MESRSESTDAQNGSFGAADRHLKDVQPGFERGSQYEEGEGDDRRRRRRDGQDVPQAPLAERIREREAG